MLYPSEPKKFIYKSNYFISYPKDMSALQRNTLNAVLAFIDPNTIFEYIELPLQQLAEMCLVKNNSSFLASLIDQRAYDHKVNSGINNKICFQDIFNPIKIIGENELIRFYFTPLAMESFVFLDESIQP